MDRAWLSVAETVSLLMVTSQTARPGPLAPGIELQQKQRGILENEKEGVNLDRKLLPADSCRVLASLGISNITGERLKEFSNARILRLQLYCGPHLWWRLYHWSSQLQIAWDTCDTGPRASSYLSFSVQVKTTVVCLCFDNCFHIFSRACDLRATGSSVLII